MEPILIYGHPAGSSLGLVAAFEWLGQPYRLCRVDMLGEMREPGFERINGRIETPVLVTPEGHIVTETMAIAHWLAARDQNQRISFDLKSPEADRMYQLMGFVNSSFTTAFGPLWVALEMENPDPHKLKLLSELGSTDVIKRHDQLEALMNGNQFLVGNHHSLADALLIGVARWLDLHKVASRDRWPKLSEWRLNLESDAAVKLATALEEGQKPIGNSSLVDHVSLKTIIDRYASL